MKITAINHITINMTNIEASLDFYGRVLGLEKLNEIDMGDHYIRYFALPNGAKLELLSYNYDTPLAQYNDTDRGMFRHLAFTVDDIEAGAAMLRAEGMKIIEGPKYSDKLGCYFMLFEDPNGCQLEFMQV